MIFFEIHTGGYKIIHGFSNSCTFDRTLRFFLDIDGNREMGLSLSNVYITFLKRGITFAIFIYLEIYQ